MNSNNTPIHPMAHLLYRSGLAMDFSHLDAIMQARRNAELGLLAPQQLQALSALESYGNREARRNAELRLAAGFPSLASSAPPRVHQMDPSRGMEARLRDTEMRQVAPQPLPTPVAKRAPEQAPEEVEDDEIETDDDDDANQARFPSKRNPNDLSTAAPVTSMEDFVKVPITTRLNNLKMPAKAKGPKPSTLSVNDTPPKQFSTVYMPKEQDVVVDMAHYPNREFKNLVRQSLPNYLTASQPKRKSLISAILSTVSDNGGHFIRFRSAQQSWVEVEKFHAERFTAQALQDAASQQGSLTASNEEPRTAAAPPSGIHPNVAAARRRPSYQMMPKRNSGRSSFSVARNNPSEIPILFKKRPSQTIPLPISELQPADRSALSIKFKRPRTGGDAPRKVSLETRNPLEFLAQMAALEDPSDGEDASY